MREGGLAGYGYLRFVVLADLEGLPVGDFAI